MDTAVRVLKKALEMKVKARKNAAAELYPLP